MKLFSLISAILISLNLAESDGAIIIDNDECNLYIGERDYLDVRHRRMVEVNLLPERCEDSAVVSIDIPHDGIKRSFNKVKSINRHQRRRAESISTDSLLTHYHYWYGEDSHDGSSFNYVQDSNGNIQGSLINMSNHSVTQISVEHGEYIAIITDSSSFKPEVHVPPLGTGRKLSTGDTESDFLDEDNVEDEEGEEGEEGEISSKITESTIEIHKPARLYLRSDNLLKLHEEEKESRSLYDDKGGNLDVMVVWTSKAECKNFGLPQGCKLTNESKAAMESLITLAVDETNTAFELSGVQTRLFLAHAYRHATFVETKIIPDLAALRYGAISGTEDNRKLYGADIVAMLVHDDIFCGGGYEGPGVDKMYSITSWFCATGYFSFGHEIGHNLGLKHDRGTDDECNKTNKYQYGYRHPDAKFRTILAYDCVPNQCDNNLGGGCTRIQRFSNKDPNYGWNGFPAGSILNDNARKINNVKSKVADFFPHGGTQVSSPSESVVSNMAQVSFPSSSSSAPLCDDSPLEFLFGGTFLDCAKVKTKNLCSESDIRITCPSTCGACDSSTLKLNSSLEFRFYHEVKKKEMTKGCTMIANHPSVRCGFVGISQSCRATCNNE